MSVQFILGRAGSGKTHYCLSAIRARLRDSAVDGPRLIFLVPEQAGQQMERDLLVGGEIAASHRAEVLSFERLARRVLESVGGDVPRVLGDAARAMVMRHLMARNADRLAYYRRPERWSGAADKLSAALAELIQEGIEPEALLAAPGEVFRDAPARRAKLADLALLFAEYRRFLSGGFLDPSQCLVVARKAFARCDWLADAEIWVDGFASMSGEESAALIELARIGTRMEITALVDPSGDDPLFSKPAATWMQLERDLRDAGLSIEPPLALGACRRFARASALEHLEHRWAAVAAPTTSEFAPSNVELIELPSRRVEVEYAVSRIWHWSCAPGAPYRLRDLAMIVRDLEPYHALLTAALEARNIPYFMDRRRPLAHHPLVEWIRAMAAVVGEDFSIESVRLLLKCGLLPLDDDRIEELENYLLAHGVAGAKAWTGADWTHKRRNEITRTRDEETPEEKVLLARVNASRRAVVELLQPWLVTTHGTNGRSGLEWATALRAAIERFQIAPSLERWTREADADGRLAEAEEHRQAWSEVFSFLDDLALAFAETPLSIDDLAGVLDAGLANLTAGLTPPTLDQLLVGAIERSRHPDIRAAVVLGFNDGLFPARPVEDAILNDDDRATLRAAGFRLTPPAREAVLDESLLAYIALTRPSEHLVVTHATTDDHGKALAPSPYVRTLTEAVPGLTVRQESDPLRSRQTWDVLSPADLRLRLAWEFQTRGPVESDDAIQRARWNELYESVRGEIRAQPTFVRALAGLVDEPAIKLSPEVLRRRFGETLSTSVSRLEKQAECPFRHFAEYTLGLSPRQEAPIEPVDIGQVHHAVLEDFVKELSDKRLHWSDLRDEGEINARLSESCGRVAAGLPSGGVLSDARNAAILRRSGRGLSTILHAQHRFWKQAKARPRGVELSFGFDESKGSLPALEITTPAKRRVRLRGRIDRVDLVSSGDKSLAVLLDYKRPRDKALNFSRVQYGLSLQLLSYWLVLEQHGGKLGEDRMQPAAALYVPLGARLRKDEDSSDDDTDTVETGKLRGVIDDAAVDNLEPNALPGNSSILAVYRKKDGSLGNLHRSDALPNQGIQQLLELVRRRIGELADAILDGDASVHPYRLGGESACEWCDMRAVCRLDLGRTKLRILPSVSRDALFGAKVMNDPV